MEPNLVIDRIVIVITVTVITVTNPGMDAPCTCSAHAHLDTTTASKRSPTVMDFGGLQSPSKGSSPVLQMIDRFQLCCKCLKGCQAETCPVDEMPASAPTLIQPEYDDDVHTIIMACVPPLALQTFRCHLNGMHNRPRKRVAAAVS